MTSGPLIGEIKALRKRDIRWLAIASIAWRVAYLPAIVFAIPLLAAAIIKGVAESFEDWSRDFFCAPFRWVSARRSRIYQRAAAIRDQRKSN